MAGSAPATLMQSRFHGVGLRCTRIEHGIVGQGLVNRLSTAPATPCLAEIVDAYVTTGALNGTLRVSISDRDCRHSHVATLVSGADFAPTVIASILSEDPEFDSAKIGSAIETFGAPTIRISRRGDHVRVWCMDANARALGDDDAARKATHGAAFFVGYRISFYDLTSGHPCDVGSQNVACLLQGAMPRHVVKTTSENEGGSEYCGGLQQDREDDGVYFVDWFRDHGRPNSIYDRRRLAVLVETNGAVSIGQDPPVDIWAAFELKANAFEVASRLLAGLT